MRRPVIIAHRGSSSIAPQNTMAAFEAAWRSGADFLELDVQVTADGEAAVIHDDTVDATTPGTGAVARMSAAALGQLDAGSWFSPRYAGERVPMLGEVIEFLRTHTEIGLVLEIKGDWPEEPLARLLESVTVPFLRDRLIVESFSVPVMEAARDQVPQLRRDLLVGEPGEDLLARCAALEVQGVGPDGRMLLADPDLVDSLHAAGLTVTPWTLNEPAHWDLATQAGVDGIVTDRPERLAGWLDGRGL